MNPLPATELDLALATVKPYAYPLDEFYLAAGLPLPLIEPVPGNAVPEPFRSLLVHEHDMTPTLEEFHGGLVHLHVLRSYTRGDTYFREVVLRTDDGGRPVEFGAIRINLGLFEPPVRRLILEERLPLGHIMKDCDVPHESHPKAFLRVQSDDFINRALGLDGAHQLYGRRNTLTDLEQRHPLAEIVEILPPVQAQAPPPMLDAHREP